MILAGYPQVSARRKVQLLPWFIIGVIVLSGLGMLPGQGEESAGPGRGRMARQPNPTAAARADIPGGYLRLYRAAVKQQCPGLPWAILAGIGKVESNHGRAQLPGVRSGLNSAGCCAGPMQFNLTDAPPSPASSAPTVPPTPAAWSRRSPATTAAPPPTHPPPPTSPTSAVRPAPTAAGPSVTSPAVSPSPERRGPPCAQSSPPTRQPTPPPHTPPAAGTARCRPAGGDPWLPGRPAARSPSAGGSL